jgi:hypothetical protein
MLCSLLLVAAGRGTSGESARVRNYIGDRALNVPASAGWVEVYRIGSAREHPDAQQKLAGYLLLATGREKDQDFARRLAGVVLKDATYEWNMAKGCIFDPGVALRVWSGGDSVLALICFSCDEVGIIVDELNPRSIRVKDADPGRAALLKLTREAFPGDSDLRDLTVP